MAYQKKPEPKIQGILQAPEIHVDGFKGASFVDGTMKILFFSDLVDPGAEVRVRRAAMMLNLSPVALVKIHAAFGTLIENLKKDKHLIFEEVKKEDVRS